MFPNYMLYARIFPVFHMRATCSANLDLQDIVTLNIRGVEYNM